MLGYHKTYKSINLDRNEADVANQVFVGGTVVRLNSGGPKMTVVDYGNYDYGDTNSYKCRWFDDKHKLVEGLFTEAELQPAVSPAAVDLQRA